MLRALRHSMGLPAPSRRWESAGAEATRQADSEDFLAATAVAISSGMTQMNRS
jgi:hypothetical protein